MLKKVQVQNSIFYEQTFEKRSNFLVRSGDSFDNLYTSISREIPSQDATTTIIRKNSNMPLNLTSEEVARLSEEQLEAYARAHLDSERTRRDLCDQASGKNRSIVIPIVVSVLSVVFALCFPNLFLNPTTLVFIAIAWLFRYHLKTNRRIDALIRLLNLERMTEKPMTESNLHD